MLVEVLNVLFAHGTGLVLALVVASGLAALVIGRRERFFRPRGGWRIAADVALAAIACAGLAAGYFGLRGEHGLRARVAAWELRSTMTGATHRLSDYRGTPVVLNVWATWCGPCRDELPALNALADRHRGRDAIVLAATDESVDDVRAFESQVLAVAAEVVTFEDKRPPYGFLGAMAYEGRPTTLILDRDGSVRHLFAGPQSLATLEKALRDVL